MCVTVLYATTFRVYTSCRRSCLSNILVIKNDVDDARCLGATGLDDDVEDILQKDLEEVEALYEEISEPIYEEVEEGRSKKSTALEYEQCLKRCLLEEKAKSLFDGASRDEILTYLEGVRDRAGSIDDEPGPLMETMIGRRNSRNRISHMSNASDSSDDSSTRFALADFLKGKVSFHSILLIEPLHNFVSRLYWFPYVRFGHDFYYS